MSTIATHRGQSLVSILQTDPCSARRRGQTPSGPIHCGLSLDPGGDEWLHRFQAAPENRGFIPDDHHQTDRRRPPRNAERGRLVRAKKAPGLHPCGAMESNDDLSEDRKSECLKDASRVRADRLSALRGDDLPARCPTLLFKHTIGRIKFNDEPVAVIKACCTSGATTDLRAS